jgi:hypothetical protein
MAISEMDFITQEDMAQARLKSAMHFVISVANENNLPLSETALSKVIFFAEIFFLDNFENLLTGATMITAPDGPAPDNREGILSELEFENKISIQASGDSKTFRSLSAPDLSPLSGERINELRRTTVDLCGNYTANLLSDMTYKGLVWHLADLGEALPIIDYYGYPYAPFTEEEIERAKRVVEKYNLTSEMD